MIDYSLYCITDRGMAEEFGEGRKGKEAILWQVEQMLKGGAKAFNIGSRRSELGPTRPNSSLAARSRTCARMKFPAMYQSDNSCVNMGNFIIQYRDKDVLDEEFEETARGIMRVFSISYLVSGMRESRRGNDKGNDKKGDRPILIINDRVEIAVRIGADGVHIGQGDLSLQEARKKMGEDKIVGVTVTSLAEAVSAELDGADYLGVSAVFTTSTKPEVRSIGLTGLRKIVRAVKIPTVAIGGIQKDNLKKVLATGVTGVAMVSEVCRSEDVVSKVRDLGSLVKSNLVPSLPGGERPKTILPYKN